MLYSCMLPTVEARVAARTSRSINSSGIVRPASKFRTERWSRMVGIIENKDSEIREDSKRGRREFAAARTENVFGSPPAHPLGVLFWVFSAVLSSRRMGWRRLARSLGVIYGDFE